MAPSRSSRRLAVHAVALARGRRSVGEAVAQVGAAVRTHGLFADHAVARVGVDLDDVLADGLEEARPTGARLELGVAGEQGGVADDAAVGAVVVAVPVLAGEGPLGAGLLGDGELGGGEPFAQLLDGLTGGEGALGHGGPFWAVGLGLCTVEHRRARFWSRIPEKFPVRSLTEQLFAITFVSFVPASGCHTPSVGSSPQTPHPPSPASKASGSTAQT